MLLNLSLIFAINQINKKQSWPFEGILGFFDYAAAQRGYQVYKEVCASCHSMQNMKFNNLIDIGFSEEESKTVAQSFIIHDELDEFGNLIARKRELKDSFPSPYKNENEAKLANNGINPPDLSCIIKARPDGANYVYSILTGYKSAPKNFHLQDGLYYNEYFPGNQIGMPEPLYNDIVKYQDGTHASIEQLARDVVIFLQYSSEPEMQTKKSLGLKIILFLIVFTILCYFTKNIIWKDIK
ncbi:MAG: cytochrome c1 [Rickettsiales bacterium]